MTAFGPKGQEGGYIATLAVRSIWAPISSLGYLVNRPITFGERVKESKPRFKQYQFLGPMADAIGLPIAIVGIFDALFGSRCQRRGVPRTATLDDVHSMLAEINRFTTTLQEFEKALRYSQPWVVETALSIDNRVADCQMLLNSLSVRLHKAVSTGYVMWPITQNETEILLEKLRRCRTGISVNLEQTIRENHG